MAAQRRVSLRPTVALLTLLCATGWAVRTSAQDTTWKPAFAPLMTRWAKDVRPDHVRAEYPRPQFQRRDWRSLNGPWEFAFDDGDRGRAAGWKSGKALPEKILVPFTFEAALSGIGKGKEIHERVWYRRTFEAPGSWRGRRLRLNFDACDWETTVWVNGRELGAHRGGYDPFSWDITDALAKGGPQELVVAVYDPADPRKGAYQPKGKQLGSEGIWYTRTTGIWQSVWLEPVAAAALDIASVRTEVNPDTHDGSVDIALRTLDRSSATVEATLSRGGKPIAEGRAEYAGGDGALKLPVRDCELWSPETPALYDLTLRVKQRGKQVDEVRSYCAFRSYDIRGGRLRLNGKPYFLRGVLDQGYWPDGILTPPTDDAIRADVETTKKLGFNMARKHVKVEDPRWYYWCDRLGLAVWQDMPSSHNLVSPDAKANFRKEWTTLIHTVRNHPSVLHWIPFNENWGDPGPFQDEIVQLTRSLDPTRPVTDASGWTQRSFTDVVDIHDYSNNLKQHGAANMPKPKVIGEYGGIALPIEGHTWTTGWGYQTVRDPVGLVRRIRFQTSQLFEAANLSGFVYTQLTDVEQELNGLLTYDRLPKADAQQLADVFTGRSRYDGATGYLDHWWVLGPLPTGTDLRTAADSPDNRAVLDKILQRPYLPREPELSPSAGAAAEYDGKRLEWKRVSAAGGSVDFHQVFGRQTQNAVSYAVAVFTAPKELNDVTLLFGSDDGARVWLNGKQVWSINHVRGVGLDDDAVPGLTLKEGRNVLVVKVAQGVGGWGAAARFEGPDGKPLALKSD